MTDEDARNSQAHFQMGRWMFETGKYLEALNSISLAIESITHTDHRALAEYLLVQGMVFYALGNYTEAIRDYSLLIDIDPERSSAHHKRAIAYLRIGEKGKAFLDFTRERELGGVVDDDFFEACQ